MKGHKRFRAGAWRLTVNAKDPVIGRRKPVYRTVHAPNTCVPAASDVDCEGGSGDGPAYTGPVRVIGPDVYELDRDGDGMGCE